MKIFLTMILALLPYHLYSNESNIAYLNTNKISGLSSNRIKALASDKYGRIWIGSNLGLDYFDSRRASREEKLFGKAINSIIPVEEGMVVDCIETCLFFSYTTGRFQSIECNGYPLRNISSIIRTKDTYIILSENKIFTTTDFSHIEPAGLTLPCSYLVKDKYGNIWGITSAEKIYRYDENLKMQKEYSLNGKSNILCIYPDEAGRVWVGTLRHGLFCYNRAVDGFVHDDISSRFGRAKLNNICAISEDRNNVIWIGHNDGIMLYDYNNNDISEINAEGLNTVTTFTRTSGNDIIAGTYFNGIFQIENLGNSIKYISLADMKSVPRHNTTANGICQGKGNSLYIGTNNSGILQIDNTLNSRKLLFYDKNESNNNVLCLEYFPSYSDVWLGTLGSGLHRLDIETGRTLEISDEDYMSGNTVTGLKKISSDSLIVANEKGIYLYDYREDSYTCIFQSTKYLSVMDIIDRNDTIYFIEPTGIIICNLKKGRVEQIPSESSEMFSCADCDRNGRLLIGTNSGKLFRLENGHIVQDTLLTGKIHLDNITNITIDRHSTTWISGGNRLTIIDSLENTFSYNLSSYIGADEFNIRSNSDIGDHVIFGTSNGIILIDKNFPYAQDSKNRANVILDNLRINNRHIHPEDGIMEYALQNTEVLRLKHNQNNIALTVSVISYSLLTQDSWTCMYRLDGYDPEWNILDKSGEIKYNNLARGKWLLHVKLTDNMHPEASVIERQLRIDIKPHPLLSVSMLVLYITILMTIAYIILRLYIKNRKSRISLQSAKQEKEQRQYLDAVKMDIFSNIAYSFKTPLSIINSLNSQLIKSLNNEQKIAYSTNIYRINELVNQLLIIKNSASNKITINNQTQSIVKMIEDIIDSLSEICREKEISINSSDYLPENINLKIDKELFNILLENLLKSIIDKAECRSTIFYYIDYTDCNDIRLTFSIKGCDNTRICGINDLFSKDIISSTLINSLSELLGITLESSEINIISLTIPTVEQEEETDYDTDEKNADEARRTEDCRVLLIDNDKSYSKYISNLLKHEIGITVCTSSEYKEIINRSEIDVVVCSQINEIKDHFKICKEIKEDTELCHISIILSLPEITEEIRIYALENGADGIIEKPINITEFKLLIHNIMNNKRSIQRYCMSSDEFNNRIEVESSKDDTFIKKVYDYIIANISDENLSVDYMASGLNMSRTQLYVRIKQITKTTPIELIYKIKMNYAEHWLRSSDLSINEISDKLGFCSTNYFSKQFKKHFGISPRDFRKSSRTT